MKVWAGGQSVIKALCHAIYVNTKVNYSKLIKKVKKFQRGFSAPNLKPHKMKNEYTLFVRRPKHECLLTSYPIDVIIFTCLPGYS